MRMRKKKWAQPELNACPYFIKEPKKSKGNWRSLFGDPSLDLQLELGCGKGESTAQMANENRNVNYVAIDLISNVLGSARRNIAALYGEEEPKNIVLASQNILNINEIFGKEDAFSRIHIYFCNPWTERGKHEKRRLTHVRQLMQYREFLQEDGEIWFKTDDDILFEASLGYFAACGFEQIYYTEDLHASGFQPNYITEHEKRFVAEGIKIKFVIMKKVPLLEASEAAID